MENDLSGVGKLQLIRIRGIEQPQFTSRWSFGDAQETDAATTPPQQGR
jgi:hypothetical protein